MATTTIVWSYTYEVCFYVLKILTYTFVLFWWSQSKGNFHLFFFSTCSLSLVYTTATFFCWKWWVSDWVGWKVVGCQHLLWFRFILNIVRYGVHALDARLVLMVYIYVWTGKHLKKEKYHWQWSVVELLCFSLLAILLILFLCCSLSSSSADDYDDDKRAKKEKVREHTQGS